MTSLPTQNQLFALYFSACGKHKVSKPNKFFLSLLAEDKESLQQRLIKFQGAEGTTGETDEGGLSEGSVDVIPLAKQTTISLANCGCLGNQGLLCVMEVLKYCPLLEEIDFSGLPSFFVSDPWKKTVSGNSVLQEICLFMSTAPRLRSINLKGHTIATDGAEHLLLALIKNHSIVSLLVEEAGIDYIVIRQINKQLERHRATSFIPLPLSSFVRPPGLLDIENIDRKTIYQRQKLQTLLWSYPSNVFSETITHEELQSIVHHAMPVTLSEVERVSRGLRGDDENLFVIWSGEMEVTFGIDGKLSLGKGDFFGANPDSVLFSGGILRVARRGEAFRIPLCLLKTVRQAWGKRVMDVFNFLHKCPLLQPLPTWVVLQACIFSRNVQLKPGEVILQAGRGFEGLLFVREGSLTPKPRRDGMKIAFTKGEVAGEEAAVSRTTRGTVDIVASLSPHPDSVAAEVIVVDSLFCLKHILPLLAPVLRVLAREYTLNSDL